MYLAIEVLFSVVFITVVVFIFVVLNLMFC